ncbi:MAG: gamma-glutamyl-gamma-aminobutyrate hydrolase family protein [Rikenellaceae bacterium]
MRAVIGVIPLWDDVRSSIWMLPGYMDAIRESGGLPIIFPLKANAEDVEQLCKMCDGFLLTGGHDVNPELYGCEASAECGAPNEDRDSLERIVFDYAVERDMPLFGICRGIQIINAFCGGTLYQDLPTEYGQEVNHQMTPPYDRPCHMVNILDNSPLHELLNRKDLAVNSYHHQAIKDLAPNLEAMAISEDGIVEAIYMPNKRFIQALQWHPELNFNVEESSRQIMRAFIASCR